MKARLLHPGMIVWACVAILFVPRCVLHAEEGLLVHYAFEEGLGSVLPGRSGGGHDGTIGGGASWPKGLPFGALSFNGKDAFVEGPTDLPIGGAGTLEVWCHPRVFGGGLISWHVGPDHGDMRASLYFDIYSMNALRGNVMNDDWHTGYAQVWDMEDVPADMVNRWSH